MHPVRKSYCVLKLRPLLSASTKSDDKHFVLFNILLHHMPLKELRSTLQGVDTLPPASQQDAIGRLVDSVVAELPQLTSGALESIGGEIDQLRTKIHAVLEGQERTQGAYNVETALEIVRKMIEGFFLLALAREKAALRDRVEMEEVDCQVLRCLQKAWEDHSNDQDHVKDGLTMAELREQVDASMPRRNVTGADILHSLEYLERQERVSRELPQEQSGTDGEVRFIIEAEGMSFLEALPSPKAESTTGGTF